MVGGGGGLVLSGVADYSVNEWGTHLENVILEKRKSSERIYLEQTKISDYLARVERAIGEANKERDFDRFGQVLTAEVEKVVVDLDGDIRHEGLNYPTPNESRATARALLWAGWVSWLWTAKAERTNPDANAVTMRPIAERLLEEFILTGRLVGKDDGRPVDSVRL